MTQHKRGFEADPKLARDVDGKTEVEEMADKDSLLGHCPNQVRGYVSDYRLVPIETEPFKHCVCCS